MYIYRYISCSEPGDCSSTASCPGTRYIPYTGYRCIYRYKLNSIDGYTCIYRYMHIQIYICI